MKVCAFKDCHKRHCKFLPAPSSPRSLTQGEASGHGVWTLTIFYTETRMWGNWGILPTTTKREILQPQTTADPANILGCNFLRPLCQNHDAVSKFQTYRNWQMMFAFLRVWVWGSYAAIDNRSGRTERLAWKPNTQKPVSLLCAPENSISIYTEWGSGELKKPHHKRTENHDDAYLLQEFGERGHRH